MQTSYVLITAARNEEVYIKHTIESIISQTILPQKWVIVSDGSIDHTDEIVSEYAANYDFIQLVHKKTVGDRDFCSKVNAINLGYEQLAKIEYDFIGILDADASFESDYYERILAKFHQNRMLGIAGGIVLDECGKEYRHRIASPWSVAGAIQFFRRKCFEDIGGFIAHELGGEDTFAEIIARLHGWEVRSFYGIKVFHHRQTGTEGKSIYLAKFNLGKLWYLLGYHPFYVLIKCVHRIKEKPYIIGSLLKLGGYCCSWIIREKRSVSDDLINYVRREQIQRLKIFFPLSKKVIGSPRITENMTGMSGNFLQDNGGYHNKLLF